MNKQIFCYCNKYIRTLCKVGEKIYVINCDAKHMPFWIQINELEKLNEIDDTDIFSFPDYNHITPKQNQIMHTRYTIIAPILPYLADDKRRSYILNSVASANNLSHMTIREWLCKYLAAQDIRSLLPKERKKRELSDNEKNFRWALNKYYYTEKKNTLTYTYKMLLKERYCDINGTLLSNYPSFFQLRYYYQKNKDLQKECIRRNGIKKYQRDVRPLLGNGVQEYASIVGVAMLDSTIADIYLINDNAEVVGRPIITVCVDANSQLLLGYSIGWEGGIYSVKNMLMNVIANKVEHCKKYGITITDDEWPCSQLPARMVTDRGSEYDSENLAQITELGVTLETLPAFRPELKGPVEKFFSLIQGYFKPPLKGAGIIEPDFQSRGAKDYRREASLTLRQFETILLKCIIFYNSKRIIENYPYTNEMLKQQIKPYSNAIWTYKNSISECNLIDIKTEELFRVLLPRTKGRFTRRGLIVNKARYKNDGYISEYLSGNEVTVCYNPDDVSKVYLLENGYYVAFELIESRYANKSLTEVEDARKLQREIIVAEKGNQLQASVDLINSIFTIRNQSGLVQQADAKNISEHRQQAKSEAHINSGSIKYDR